ncbi:hypothetical protein BDV93DRAFT_516772 [Ceratobasidium sp. AG-I]|nr:hypothetical protein BDV93DRAFT_516772 [Ceratobasidium sp. AG-I]
MPKPSCRARETSRAGHRVVYRLQVALRGLRLARVWDIFERFDGSLAPFGRTSHGTTRSSALQSSLMNSAVQSSSYDAGLFKINHSPHHLAYSPATTLPASAASMPATSLDLESAHDSDIPQGLAQPSFRKYMYDY